MQNGSQVIKLYPSILILPPRIKKAIYNSDKLTSYLLKNLWLVALNIWKNPDKFVPTFKEAGSAGTAEQSPLAS